MPDNLSFLKQIHPTIHSLNSSPSSSSYDWTPESVLLPLGHKIKWCSSAILFLLLSFSSSSVLILLWANIFSRAHIHSHPTLDSFYTDEDHDGRHCYHHPFIHPSNPPTTVGRRKPFASGSSVAVASVRGCWSCKKGWFWFLAIK